MLALNGVLLIVRRGDALQIQAQATASGPDVCVDLSDGEKAEAAMPHSLIWYVVRSRDPVVLENAGAQNLFSGDPYLVGAPCAFHSCACHWSTRATSSGYSILRTLQPRNTRFRTRSYRTAETAGIASRNVA